MMAPMKKLFAPIIALMILAGCQTTPPPAQLPEITFAHLPPLKLAVGNLSIRQAYRPKMTAPYVDHLFPTPPVLVVQRWAEERLVPQGGGSSISFTIVDASVREVALERIGGLRGALTTEQSERYEARIEAVAEILDAQGMGTGRVRATATRLRTIPEDASLADRERLWFEMTEALMADFNAEMEKNIRAHLGRWLR